MDKTIDRPDLRTIDFTITEVLGKFTTTPRCAAKLNIDGAYVCIDCLNTVEPDEYMFLDFQEPEERRGWHHFRECTKSRRSHAE
jgi:hypothetical protein